MPQVGDALWKVPHISLVPNPGRVGRPIYHMPQVGDALWKVPKSVGKGYPLPHATNVGANTCGEGCPLSHASKVGAQPCGERVPHAPKVGVKTCGEGVAPSCPMPPM